MQSAISKGMKHSAKEYLDAVDFMERSYESYKEVFEDYHGVLSPCSTGVADKGLKSTGSADFNEYGRICIHQQFLYLYFKEKIIYH